MTALNKQALREAAQEEIMLRSVSDTSDAWQDEASPEAVLALLDELEAAQSYAKDRDEENQDLMLTVGRLRVEREASEVELANALCELLPGTQYMDPPDGGSVTPLEQVRRMVAERIAILESRKVCVPRISNDEFWLSFNNRIVFREETYRSAVTKAIEDAGIGVKGE